MISKKTQIKSLELQVKKKKEKVAFYKQYQITIGFTNYKYIHLNNLVCNWTQVLQNQYLIKVEHEFMWYKDGNSTWSIRAPLVDSGF